VLVELVCEGKSTRGLSVRNISAGGVFIEGHGDQIPEIDCGVLMHFTVPGNSGGAHTLQGRVMRTMEDGFVVIFVNFDLPDLEFIERLEAQ